MFYAKSKGIPQESMSLIFYPFEEGTARDIASAIQFFKAQTMTQNYPFKTHSTSTFSVRYIYITFRHNYS